MAAAVNSRLLKPIVPAPIAKLRERRLKAWIAIKPSRPFAHDYADCALIPPEKPRLRPSRDLLGQLRRRTWCAVSNASDPTSLGAAQAIPAHRDYEPVS